ncbi:MAG: hypothetical protein O3A84_16815, partial [Proteobacteria bacterium]|nr:hypothetical protein [Pseudomonadota bacterium]
MTILRIESLVYGVDREALADGIRFYDDFGLGVVEKSDDGAIFKTRENQTIVIRPSDDPALPPTFEEGSTVRETIFGVDTQEALDAIEAELARDRDVKKDDDGTLHVIDPAQLAVGFRLAKIEEVGIDAPLLNFQDAVPRMNRRIVDDAADGALDKGEQINPLRIGHVVWGVPDGTRDAAVEFYTERLNFKLTDIVNGMGDFMRCDGSTYHHVWFLTHGRKPGFNHVA